MDWPLGFEFHTFICEFEMTMNNLDVLPLVVDLDGTLLKSDLLFETGMAFVRSQPLSLLKPLAWVAKGKAQLKEKLAQAAPMDVSVLPYDAAVIELIETARKAGRKIVLATASHHILADRISNHLELFDQVLATHSECNLSSHRKRDLLIEHFSEKGFDYVGNSHDDLAVWAAARHAYVVNPEQGVEKKAQALGNVEQVIRSNISGPKDWLKALRLHQWMKNALIFVPLLAAHQITRLCT